MGRFSIDASTFSQRLDTTITAHDFSGVVMLREHGTVVYARAAGFADRSNRIPNTLDTRFGIASGTKFFTALAIGKLIEAGALGFDTRVADCVQIEVPAYAREITIRQLLTHTSGIPDYYDEEQITDFDNFAVGVPWYELKGPKDYLAVFPDEPPKFTPGARFSYSNGGYILLGIVVEEVAGQPYRSFVEEAVFRPAGMIDSGYFAMNRLPPRTAQGYIEEADGGWRTNIYTLPIIGASDGGAYTTASDMMRLWDAFWAGEVLSPDMVIAFTEPYVKAGSEDPDAYYGHGIWISAKAGPAYREYITGCDAGVSFDSSVLRESGLQFTVLSNTTDGAWPVLRELKAALGI